MAIQENTIGDTIKEIYVTGENNWLTENLQQTDSRTFCKRRILVGNQRAEDWKEITDAEKERLEQLDANAHTSATIDAMQSQISELQAQISALNSEV